MNSWISAPTSQQRLVEAAAGQGHDGGIVALGHDDNGMHTAHGRGRKRRKRPLVGHEIGSRQDEFLARHVDRRLDHPDQRLVLRIHAGAHDLHGSSTFDFRGRQRDEMIQVLGAVHVPVLDEQHLQVADGRSLDPEGGVDPGGEARLGMERLFGDVVAAGVAHLPVEDRDLAVVAHVEADRRDLGDARRQSRHHFDPALPQLPAQFRFQEVARSDVVDQEPALHPPLLGADQGIPDGASGTVLQIDVEEQVGMVLCAIDIPDQRRDEVLRAREQRQPVPVAGRRVTAEPREARDRLGSPGDHRRVLRVAPASLRTLRIFATIVLCRRFRLLPGRTSPTTR